MDPFSLVFNALWELAEGSSVLTSLVKPGNRPHLDDDRYTAGVKNEVNTADLPELILLPVSANGNIRNTSSSTMITRQYTWVISTGDSRPNFRLHPVEFALYAEMANWPLVINALLWNGYKFATMTNVVNAEQGESDPERNRGIKGWSALWTIEVRMDFRTADLLAYGAGSGSGS